MKKDKKKNLKRATFEGEGIEPAQLLQGPRKYKHHEEGYPLEGRGKKKKQRDE